MGLFKVKLSYSPNVIYHQTLKVIINIILYMKIIEYNNCHSTLEVAVEHKYKKEYIFLNLRQNKGYFHLVFQLNKLI